MVVKLVFHENILTAASCSKGEPLIATGATTGAEILSAPAISNLQKTNLNWKDMLGGYISLFLDL